MEDRVKKPNKKNLIVIPEREDRMWQWRDLKR